jgi:hypothetical protein
MPSLCGRVVVLQIPGGEEMNEVKIDTAAEIRRAIHNELESLLPSDWAKDFNGNVVIDAAVRVAVEREGKLRVRAELANEDSIRVARGGMALEESLRAEIERLQARFEKALALCDAYNTTLAYKVHAALTGESDEAQ